jgi:hypothetical protein
MHDGCDTRVPATRAGRRAGRDGGRAPAPRTDARRPRGRTAATRGPNRDGDVGYGRAVAVCGGKRDTIATVGSRMPASSEFDAIYEVQSRPQWRRGRGRRDSVRPSRFGAAVAIRSRPSRFAAGSRAAGSRAAGRRDPVAAVALPAALHGPCKACRRGRDGGPRRGRPPDVPAGYSPNRAMISFFFSPRMPCFSPTLRNAARAVSRCSFSWAADSCVRIRAWPFGTTGKKKPTA